MWSVVFLLFMLKLLRAFEFEPIYPPEEHVAFIEGDIITLPHKHGPTIRNLVSSPRHLWPNKTLIYEFSNEFHPLEKLWIKMAIQSLENKTCVRFIERTDQVHHMYIRNAVGCASPVGYNEVGRMQMYLSLPGCIRWGTIQHEFLHALGFWHEHTRHDRNKYVQVNWDNIIKGMEVNFALRDIDEAHARGLPYDFGSVMHYRGSAFAKDESSPTIVPLQNGVSIGQRERYSQLDLAKLNRLYDCGSEYYLGDDLETLINENEISSTETNNIIDNLNLIKDMQFKLSYENKMFKKLSRRRRQNYFPHRDPRLDIPPPPPPPFWPPMPPCTCCRTDQEPEHRRCGQQHHSRRQDEKHSTDRRPRYNLSNSKPVVSQNFEQSERSNSSSGEEYDYYDSYANEKNTNTTQYVSIKNKDSKNN